MPAPRLRHGGLACLTPRYIFYDGPPFATGLPHYGHILAGTIKACAFQGADNNNTLTLHH